MQEMHDVHAGGPSLLTARQVQGMLGVDRSTVYRMAEDGRLPALKIGRQWRFPQDRIHRVLAGNRSMPGGDAAPGLLPAGTAWAAVSVAADLLGVMMVVTDMSGRPLTAVANPCARLATGADDAAGIAACLAEWRLLADDPDFEPQFRAGPLGFECARAFVRSGSSLVGMVLAGGVAPPGDGSPDLHLLDEAQRRRVLTALPRVAATLSRAVSSHPTPTPGTTPATTRSPS